MTDDTPRSRANVFDIFTQNLDLESNESEFSDLSDPDDPQYEPGRIDRLLN